MAVKMPFEKIREGNRGGQGLFDLESIRYMSYKDRESYLGYSTKIGFLDKGGKWRKKDWWTKKEFDQKMDDAEKQKRMVQMNDQKRMNIALGIEEDLTEMPSSKINEYEYQLLMQKQSLTGEFESDQMKELEKHNGLGVNTNLKLNLNSNLSNIGIRTVGGLYLEGEGIDQQEQSQQSQKIKITNNKDSISSTQVNQKSIEQNDQEIKHLTKQNIRELRAEYKVKRKEEKRKEKQLKKMAKQIKAQSIENHTSMGDSSSKTDANQKNSNLKDKIFKEKQCTRSRSRSKSNLKNQSHHKNKRNNRISLSRSDARSVEQKRHSRENNTSKQDFKKECNKRRHRNHHN